MARKLAIMALVALSAVLALLPGGPAAASEPVQLSALAQPVHVLGTALTLKAGDLDPTFDGDGKVITDFGGTEYLGGVAMQADGKIVAAGQTYDPATFHDSFALARYAANGSLDSGFGSGGKVRTDFGPSPSAGWAVAIQSDGKIVVAGDGGAVGARDAGFALARYNPDGSLDSGFGGSGTVVTNLQRTDSASGLAIQADGKIVAVGQTRATTGGSDYDFGVVRYNPNGSLDTSFGGVGYVITPFTSAFDAAASVLVQPDGKIVAAGVANAASPSTQDLALARYNPDGSLDGSFGVAGKVETQDPAAIGAQNVAIQPDGKLVVAGGIVARYSPNGSLDPSFGSNGKVALAGISSAGAVLVQADRKLVVAGNSYGQGRDIDFLVARLQPGGSVDAAFGDSGQVHTDLATNSHDVVRATALQSDRRIVVAGATDPGSGGQPRDFALVRYLNPAPCVVPNVRGKKLLIARSAITRAHCKVGKVKRKASKRVKRGRVISQSPKARTTLPNLGKVNLVVSRGRKR
jgi:uncharacterized delta-60 repeat protein